MRTSTRGSTNRARRTLRGGTTLRGRAKTIARGSCQRARRSLRARRTVRGRRGGWRLGKWDGKGRGGRVRTRDRGGERRVRSARGRTSAQERMRDSGRTRDRGTRAPTYRAGNNRLRAHALRSTKKYQHHRCNRRKRHT